MQNGKPRMQKLLLLKPKRMRSKPNGRPRKLNAGRAMLNRGRNEQRMLCGSMGFIRGEKQYTEKLKETR